MLKAMTPGARKGADFLAHVDPGQLRAAGVEVVGFYLKNASKPIIAAYQQAGISVFLIHQRGYEGRGPNPAAAGHRHGLEATEQAQALGYPKDMPIMFASMGDYDNTLGTLSGSVAYWNAAQKACAYPAGVYGDHDLLQQLGPRSALSVQAAAKAWSYDWLRMKWKGPHPTAHMLQYPSIAFAKGSAQFPGERIDPLDILRPFKAWANLLPDPVPVKLPAVPKPTLRRSRSIIPNAEVRKLQAQLKFFRWYKGPEDGLFWRQTEAGVKELQRKAGVLDDGIYGPVTAAAWQRFLGDLVALKG